MKLSKQILLTPLMLIAVPSLSFAEALIDIKARINGEIVSHQVSHLNEENVLEKTGLYTGSTSFLYGGKTTAKGFSIDVKWLSEPIDNTSDLMVSSLSATLYKEGEQVAIEDVKGNYFSIPNMNGVTIKRIYQSEINKPFTVSFPSGDTISDATITVTVVNN